LASGSSDATIKIWDIFYERLKFTFNQTNGGHFQYITSLVKLDNGLFASASGDSTIKIWDLKKNMLKNTFFQGNGGHFASVYSLVYLGNNLLASGSQGYIFYLES
jgi:WD40 repeat protein